MSRTKPRTWLLGLIPILLGGIILLSAEVHLEHRLEIVSGIGLTLAIYALLYVWISVYEARVAWKETQHHPADAQGSDVGILTYWEEDPDPEETLASPKIQARRRREEPTGQVIVEIPSISHEEYYLNLGERRN